MEFYDEVKQTLDNTVTTENGAIGYKSSGKALTDFLFALSSLRGEEEKTKKLLEKMLDSKEPYVLKLLFYIRDVREGLGEINTFKVALKTILIEHEDLISREDKVKLLKLIPEFGKWKDIFSFLFINMEIDEIVVSIVKSQLAEDIINYEEKKSISLLSKWMPSINTSSKDSRKKGRYLASKLQLTNREYRKTLSLLRKYSDVLEVKTCGRNWDKIDYNSVPSKANVKYARSFLEHDSIRRRKYLEDLLAGVDKDGNKVKINSSVNFPHEVLNMYNKPSFYGSIVKEYDETIEQLWKNLKEAKGLNNTIVVRDDSGSMVTPVNNSNVTALTVATALSIYCAEHNSKAYKNRIITFSTNPRYLDFSDPEKYPSLYSKYKYLDSHNEVSDTNVEKVFDLVLKTAVENNLKQSELPKQILILSDMEFNEATWSVNSYDSLFSIIENKYKNKGYELPKLIFWNLCSRTNVIPFKENPNGLLLISGFSQNVLNMISEDETNPYDSVVKCLNKERYKDIPLVKY